MKNLEKQIADSLKELCVPPHLQGYDYLKSAIAICVDEPSAIHNITKGLYPAVAELHGTTPPRAERAMRHAISTGSSECKFDVISKYLGNNYFDKSITNAHFIAAVSEYIRLNASEG